MAKGSTIYPEMEEFNVLQYNASIDEDQRLSMALVSYERLRNSMNRDDRKLISMLDRDIIDFFDSQLTSGSQMVMTKINEYE